MPSGAKKRKAAKRKKEMGFIHPDSPTNIPQGNRGMEDEEGLNRHDSGEFGSPTSQENRPFVAEEEGGEDYKEKRGDSPDFRLTQELMESSENGSKEHGEPVIPQKISEEEVSEEEVLSTPPPPPPPSAPSDERVSEDVIDVSVELVQSENGEGVGGLEEMSQPAENSTERVVEKAPVSDLSQQEGSSSVSNEVVQDTDALVENQNSPVSISEEETQVCDVSIENFEGSATAETSSERTEENAVPLSDTVGGHDDSGEHGPGNESGEVGETAEAVLPPHAAHRASWVSCCGIFDALVGSRR